jgi:hypothetical protein
MILYVQVKRNKNILTGFEKNPKLNLACWFNLIIYPFSVAGVPLTPAFPFFISW